MTILRWLRLFSLTTFAIFFIAACASNTGARGTFDAKNPQWQGRLALKVHSTPVQAFSADFALQGNAQAGSLVFTTPLGNTVAQLQWSTQEATLTTTGEPQRFESLAALTRQATGTELPIASLFAWLQGSTLPTPGWEADLRELPSGRLSARQLDTGNAPWAEFKIILDPN